MSGLAATVPAPWTRCRLCRVKLDADKGDDLARGVCDDCRGRPEARRLAHGNGVVPPLAAVKDTDPRPTRDFTTQESALIRAMAGYVPLDELLRILNDRLAADVGDAVRPYTKEQLYQQAARLGQDGREESDWTRLRRLIAQARKSGLLARVTDKTLEDFGVVFQLSTAQTTQLRDVIQHARRK